MSDVNPDRVVPMRPSQKEKTVTAKAPPGATSIFAKIIEASKEVPPLVKREDHEEGFSFVSIDDYYEKAAKVLFKHGVSWNATESYVGPISEHYDALGWRFHFSLYDSDGNIVQNFCRVTVPHDIEGPQTAGKVMSYAEKVFLRQLLKLVTGEADADSSPTKRNRGSRRKVDIPVPEQTTVDFMPALLQEIGQASSIDALNLIVEKNKRAILNAKDNDPGIYGKIAAARETRMKELE